MFELYILNMIFETKMRVEHVFNISFSFSEVYSFYDVYI